MYFSLQEIFSFIGIVTLLVMLPGANTVLVMQSVGISGRRTAFYNLAGIASALYCHALLSALGLSLMIVGSAELFGLIKHLGAGYIIYLGLNSLYAAYRLQPAADDDAATEATAAAAVAEHGVASFAKGFIANILNPKVAIFFLAFFPQFLHSDAPVFAQSMFLTVVYSCVQVCWYSLLILALDRFRGFLADAKVKRRLGAVTGVLLVGLGLRIVVQK